MSKRKDDGGGEMVRDSAVTLVTAWSKSCRWENQFSTIPFCGKLVPGMPRTLRS